MASDRLFELAFRYKKTRLWNEMFEDQLFAVRLARERIGYVSIMGILGEHNAVALYVGDEGLKSYFTMSSHEFQYLEETDYNPAFLNNICLHAAFDGKEYLDPDEIEAAKAYASAHKIKIAGKNAYPHFIKNSAGFIPWPVESKADEEDLIAALETAIAVAAGPIVNGFDFRDFPEIHEGSHEIPLIEKDGDGFILKMIPMPEVEPYSAPRGEGYDADAAAQIKRFPQSKTLLAGLMIIPAPTGWDQSDIPVIPTCLFVIEEETEMMLPVQPVALYETRTDVMLNKFMEALQRAGVCPAVIKAGDEYTEALLEKWCSDMDIELECDFMDPVLLMAKRDFLDRYAMGSDEDEMLEDMELELELIMGALATGEISANDPNLKEMIAAFKVTAALPGFPDSIREKVVQLETMVEGNTRPKKSSTKVGKTQSKTGRKSRRKSNGVTISISLQKGCYRHLLISDDVSLAMLASYILSAFSFDNDHLHAFFMDDRLWSHFDSYFCEFADEFSRPTTEETKLWQTDLHEGKKFKFLFDFGDEWVFQCKVLHIENRLIDIPLVIRSVGDAPEQYPEWDDFEEDD